MSSTWQLRKLKNFEQICVSNVSYCCFSVFGRLEELCLSVQRSCVLGGKKTQTKYLMFCKIVCKNKQNSMGKIE